MISDKSILIAICCGFCLTACNGSLQDNTLSNLSKLENLYCVRPDSVMDYYDLSGDSLKEFPDLSRYVIRSLNLSHNQLDTIIPERLPLGLERLDLSHNRIEGLWYVKPFSFPILKVLNLSHNRLEGSLIMHRSSFFSLTEVDLSHNSLEGFTGPRLRKLVLAHNRLDYELDAAVTDYLDVSYNKDLYPRLSPNMNGVDTLVRTGAAGGKPLSFPMILGWNSERKAISSRFCLKAEKLMERYADRPDSLRKALKQMSASIRAYKDDYNLYRKAVILTLLGQYAKAQAWLHEIENISWLKNRLNNDLLLQGILLELCGQEEEARNRYAMAVPAMKKNLRQSNNAHSLTNFMVMLYVTEGKPYTAREAWIKVFGGTSLPDGMKDEELLHSLASAFSRGGRKEVLEALVRDKELMENFLWEGYRIIL